MFEVNGVYANRKGKYTILELRGDRMRVRYSDGSEAELRVEMQERIWQNIAAEEEAREAVRRAREAKRRLSQNTSYFIKAISIPADDMTFPGWQERVVLIPEGTPLYPQSPGDRLIYYSLEAHAFFAVVTITGPSFMANPKKYTFAINQAEGEFYPVDIDASAPKPSVGIYYDSIELESQPNFGKTSLTAESFIPINEDDFELLAEALTEISEDDELLDEEEVEEDEDE